MIETVASAPGTRCTATGPFQHLCPVKDETDRGTITVQWTTTDVTVELHALAAYLATWANAHVTHEDACLTIARTLTASGVTATTATYEGETAGLTITVTGGGSDSVSREPVRG